VFFGRGAVDLSLDVRAVVVVAAVDVRAIVVVVVVVVIVAVVHILDNWLLFGFT
jgi:hypothetical protein